LKDGDFVLVEKYGKGPHCLLWGQKPTLERQIVNMKRFKENENLMLKSAQRGNKICGCCGYPLPRSRKMKMHHRFNCGKNRVKGIV